MSENKPSEPSEPEILIDYDEVYGYKVRPWSILKTAEMTPVFEKIILEMKSRKLTFKDFFSKSVEGNNVKLEMLNIDQLFFILTPVVPDILAVTLGIEKKDIDSIPTKAVPSLIATIFNQNFEYLKNWFALISSSTEMLGSITV